MYALQIVDSFNGDASASLREHIAILQVRLRQLAPTAGTASASAVGLNPARNALQWVGTGGSDGHDHRDAVDGSGEEHPARAQEVAAGGGASVT
jgi:hypothetical protein